MAQLIAPSDDRLSWWSPQPPLLLAHGMRLPRFPRSVAAHLAGQIGPLANLRSSSGCGVRWRSDSPWVEVRLSGLHHHQPFPVSIALEIEDQQGIRSVCSPDLREHRGELAVWLPTGCERGGPRAQMTLWLPLISTCDVAGILIADGAQLAPAPPLQPRWLAIGDSLTQGFSVQSPLDAWVHRLARRFDLPVWNLGVGGIRIEPEVFVWALATRTWDLVTIALGSNHAWRDEDLATLAERAAELARIACSGQHRRLVWLLPPWKPCEDGLGPTEFQGVPLNGHTAARLRAVRQTLADALAAFAPRLELISDYVPHDPRLLPDGLHPQAHGSALIAQRLEELLAPAAGAA
ncbi:MAG: GDSL-type esterase/lipase family protein [Planctomycetota bacterium]|nr:GDSL-type esterase/lipase family protein [Planctomycetota bacterium]MDW8372116.1 GDSL-type esterase/lipase family protein [Planctomycetota bacterium]